MIRNNNIRKSLKLAAVSFTLYLMTGLIFGFLGMTGFDNSTGPKYFLPLTLGILFGPAAAIGMTLASIGNSLIVNELLPAALWELLVIQILSAGGRYLWYFKRTSSPCALKRIRDFVKYSLITVLLSAVCAVLGLFFQMQFMPILVSYTIWNLLLGTLTIIFATSIIGMVQITPLHCPILYDVDMHLPIKPSSIDIIGDTVDGLCEDNKFNINKGFWLQSTLEECLLLLITEGHSTNIQVRVRIQGSIIVDLLYDGISFNPFRAKMKTQQDTWSLLLLRERALRISYQYHNEINILRIVQ